MTPWNILEINPTSNVSEIKKAYAKQLKIHQPEDDPEGFQTLRNAYESALKLVKFMNNTDEDESHDIVNSQEITVNESHSADLNSVSIEGNVEFHSINSLSYDIMQSEINLQESINSEDQNDKFMSQIETLYNDFFSRIKIANWEILLNSDVMWDIDNREKLSNLMLDFLIDHNYLPQEIWKLLDSNFNWCDTETTTYCNNEEFIKYIQKQISQQKLLRYSFFNVGDMIDFDSYLKNRQNAFNAFSENNHSATKLYIDRANKIYQNDPDLLLIEGSLYLRIGTIDDAILIFSKLLLIEPDNLDAIFYRGTAYFEKKQFGKAIDDFNYVYSKTPTNPEITLFLAKSYFKLDKLEESKEWIVKTINSNPSSNEAKSLQSQVYTKLKIKLTNELKNNPYDEELKSKLTEITTEILQNNNRNSNVKANKAKNNKVSFFQILILLLILKLLLFVLGAEK